MKSLALKNPESVTADVVLEVTKDCQCDFCGEEDKAAVVGIKIPFNRAKYIGSGYRWSDIEQTRHDTGLLGKEVYCKTLKPDAEKVGLYDLIEDTVEPCICLDCIRQLAKLIPKA